MSQLHSQPLVVSDDPFECVSGIPVKGSSQVKWDDSKMKNMNRDFSNFRNRKNIYKILFHRHAW